jgi:hypothetical protein
MKFSFDYGSEVEEDSFFSTSAEASVGEEENFVLFALYTEPRGSGTKSKKTPSSPPQLKLR